MKILDYFKLAKTNLERNTKLFWKNTILIAISITVLLVSYITTSSMNNMLDRSIKYNTSFRTIYVKNKDNINLETLIEEIEDISHIDKVIKQGNYNVNVDVTNINNEKNEGRINLLGANEKISPQIIKGRKMHENEYNVCIVPKNFYTGDINQKINNNELIDGEKLLDKEIEIVYYAYDYTQSVPIRTQEYSKKLKVVGIYDTEDNMGDYNECYVNFDIVEDINNTISYGLNAYGKIEPVIAIIDNSNNVDEVIQKLSNLNYETLLYATPNYTLINIIDYAGKIIAISIIVLVLINIIVNSVKNTQDRKKEFGLLKALGYKKSNIWKIILVESLVSGVVSFIIACIITIIILVILLQIQNNSVLEIQKIKILINYTPFIICFFIAIAVPGIGNVLSSISVVNKSVISNSQE